MGFEQFDQLGEVSEGAGKTIDLVDDHGVDLPGFDVGEKLPEGRALQTAAAESAVVVAVPDRRPASCT
jgi:hypothetical protein